ncbi:MAG TPA: hypothetical protein ENJ82_10360 [Bacteroidetes bacterium]|nr:hypothetical protein [Bacteroidota bacterium]
MAFCLLLFAACGEGQRAKAANFLEIGEAVNPEKVDFRIRKGGNGILVLRQGHSGLFWYVMNETPPRSFVVADLPGLVVGYRAACKEKNKREVFNIDVDENLDLVEVGKFIQAVKLAGVEKYNLMTGIWKMD